MQSFFFAFCNMELSVWHVMSENNANIKTLLFFFNLFNTHSGCKVRKKLVTLRSKRRKNALRRKILNVSASDERSKAVKKVIFIKLLI
jgi:hypothetical protein